MAAFNFFAEGGPDIARTLRAEHEQLQSGLTLLTAKPGPIGEAALRLAQFAAPHTRLEEAIYYPALANLRDLVRGGATPEKRQAIQRQMSRLGRLYRRIERQHQTIITAAEQLFALGQKEGNPQAIRLVQMLRNHEQIEAQLYWDAQQAVILSKQPV